MHVGHRLPQTVHHQNRQVGDEEPPLDGFHVTEEENEGLVQGDTH